LCDDDAMRASSNFLFFATAAFDLIRRQAARSNAVQFRGLSNLNI
jgi:hypothetical protein